MTLSPLPRRFLRLALGLSLGLVASACDTPGRQDVVYYDLRSDADFDGYASFRVVAGDASGVPEVAAETLELTLEAAQEQLASLGLEPVEQDPDLELVALVSAADPDASEAWACEEDWSFWGEWDADWAPCDYLDPVTQPYTDASVLLVLRDTERSPQSDPDAAVFGGVLIAVADGWGNDASRIQSSVARLFSYYPAP